MERHRCKLCSKSFLNGRALGGHMRSHLATLPLPVNKFHLTESDSSSTRSHHDRGDRYEELVVQDRESETESTQNNPTRRRSKRTSQRSRESFAASAVLVDPPSKKKRTLGGSESATESTPLSSVSDPSQDEEVALCLMMLSRDVWVLKEDTTTYDSAELKSSSTRPTAKFKCMGCRTVFRTSRALAGHKASNRQCCQQEAGNCDQQKIFECPFCYRVFGSGQALGGHKRSHLLGSSTANNSNDNLASNNATSSNADQVGENTSFVLDLNLPAPLEDEDVDH